jgi:hypothetical protein
MGKCSDLAGCLRSVVQGARPAHPALIQLCPQAGSTASLIEPTYACLTTRLAPATPSGFLVPPQGSMVNVGLRHPVQMDRRIKAGVRVTLELLDHTKDHPTTGVPWGLNGAICLIKVLRGMPWRDMTGSRLCMALWAVLQINLSPTTHHRQLPSPRGAAYPRTHEPPPPPPPHVRRRASVPRCPPRGAWAVLGLQHARGGGLGGSLQRLALRGAWDWREGNTPVCGCRARSANHEPSLSSSPVCTKRPPGRQHPPPPLCVSGRVRPDGGHVGEGHLQH